MGSSRSCPQSQNTRDFAAAVATNSYIRELYLRQNGIGYNRERITDLAVMISGLSQLEVLDLTDNALGSVNNTAEILEAAPPSLIKYFLGNNIFNTNKIGKIEEVARISKSRIRNG